MALILSARMIDAVDQRPPAECVAYKLTNKQVGLTKYEVLATTDLAELERVLLEARAHQAHQKRLLSLVADLPARKRRPATTRAPRVKRVRPRKKR